MADKPKRRPFPLGSIVQGLGLAAVAGGVTLIAIWAGIVTFGVGLILYGIAIERSQSS